MKRRLLAAVAVLAAALLTIPFTMDAQFGVKTGDWRAYGGDGGSTFYSSVDQINRENVQNLQVAWTFKTDNFAPNAVPQLQTTPVMANGVLYFTAGPRRNVVAIDAGTGETKWVYRPEEGARSDRAPRRITRGVAYWTDGKEERIITVTPGYHLIALNARTGQPVPGFGNDGIVDMFREIDDREFKGELIGQLGNSSPPVVAHDTIVVGAALPVGVRVNKENVKADVLAFDVRTGKRKWVFHTIPRKGEPGAETWLTGLETTGNTGVWAPFSVDEELGYVYLPVEAPTNDVYGGHRHGDNLYSSSIVCVDIRTGEKKWHFQHIHHDIWDRDTAAAPILLDINVEGRPIKAVVLLTKQGFAFVFDRTNGRPVWPIEERPVPQSDVPGERTSPTQPFPSKPPAFDLQGVTPDDLIDFTPALRAEALAAVKPYRLGPLFTPPSLAEAPDGTRGLVMVPQYNGGVNWQGGAADPETGFVYVATVRNHSTVALAPGGNLTSAYVGGGGGARGPQGLPLLKPPYGQIVAFDMNKGDIAWRIPNGNTPPNIQNHAALKGVSFPPTGSASHAMLLATRTLLFSGEGLGGQPYFRALDKRTGQVLWEHRIPTGGSSTGKPMTYLHNGRQFIVFAAAGEAGGSAQLIAYALPAGGGQRGGARGARGGGPGPAPAGQPQ